MPKFFIFQVISASAQELSQPIKTSSYDLSRHLPLPKIPGMTSKERPEWQLVVEERIKSKTKIISHVIMNIQSFLKPL